ncbi:hypothetical protein, partial [Pontibacter sp. BAB1700]|uniref:hypothetical protein n=1 Tax=Pontibacter sp. BAB1700 TaxID=1144253 RepID=UPI00026BD29A
AAGKRKKKFCQVIADLKSLLTFATRSEAKGSKAKKKSACQPKGLKGKKKKIEILLADSESFSDLCTPKTTDGRFGKAKSKTRPKTLGRLSKERSSLEKFFERLLRQKKKNKIGTSARANLRIPTASIRENY